MPAPKHAPQAQTGPPPPAALVNAFRTTITSRGYLSLADTMANVLLLPGIPDTLEIHVMDNPAVLTVTDEQGRDGREVTIPANTSSDTFTRDRLIRGRNFTPLSIARVQIIARWL